MINMPGGPELLVIVVIALVVLGPQQLPKAMRTMGNVMSEIRKISNGFQNEMRSAMDSMADDAPVKPQSGSMHPVDTTASELTSSSDVPATEVVARNPAPSGGSDDAVAEGGGVEPPARPAIDPVDRAAG